MGLDRISKPLERRGKAGVRWLGVAMMVFAGCLYQQRTLVEVPDSPPDGRLALKTSNPANGAAAMTVSLTSGSNLVPSAVPQRDWRYIVLHHSGAPLGSVASIDRDHRERRDSAGRTWRGIGYHFVIGNGRGMPDGQVEPTFRWREQLAGAHAGNTEFNESGIGICLIGDFQANSPTDRQLASCRALVSDLRQQFHLTDDSLRRHSEIKATACPGQHFSLASLALDGPRQARAAVDSASTP